MVSQTDNPGNLLRCCSAGGGVKWALRITATATVPECWPLAARQTAALHTAAARSATQRRDQGARSSAAAPRPPASRQRAARVLHRSGLQNNLTTPAVLTLGLFPISFIAFPLETASVNTCTTVCPACSIAFCRCQAPTSSGRVAQPRSARSPHPLQRRDRLQTLLNQPALLPSIWYVPFLLLI